MSVVLKHAEFSRILQDYRVGEESLFVNTDVTDFVAVRALSCEKVDEKSESRLVKRPMTETHGFHCKTPQPWYHV